MTTSGIILAVYAMSIIGLWIVIIYRDYMQKLGLADARMLTMISLIPVWNTLFVVGCIIVFVLRLLLVPLEFLVDAVNTIWGD